MIWNKISQLSLPGKSCCSRLSGWLFICVCSSQSIAEGTACFFKNCCYRTLQYSDTRKSLQLRACLISWISGRNAPSLSSPLHYTFWQDNMPNIFFPLFPPLTPRPQSLLPFYLSFIFRNTGEKTMSKQGCCFCLLFDFLLPWTDRKTLVILPVCPARTTSVPKFKGSGSG